MTSRALVIALLFVPTSVLAQTGSPSISLTPARPAPGETVAFTVRGASSCSTSLAPVTVSGNIIVIQVNCGGTILGAPFPYEHRGTFSAPQATGTYQVEHWFAFGTRFLVSSRQLIVASDCALTNSLVADRSAALVGENFLLTWCDLTDPSGPYGIYASRSLSGPFTRIMDVAPASRQASIFATSSGPNYFYVDRGTSRSNVITVQAANAFACFPSPATLCLQNGRFEAAATFRTPGATTSDSAHAVALTDQSGYFWFFGPENVEVTLKVLNACPSAYWVFASGMTNVAVEITVTDRVNGSQRKYSNPQGTPFTPIQDTNAFVCP
jgi:hypothetical protein